MKVRELTEADRAVLTAYIAKDEYHRGMTGPDFFYQGRTLVYEDEHGPVFFVKMTPVCRLDIQFDNESRVRNSKMLLHGFPGMTKLCTQMGFKEIVFDSVSKGLVGFLKRVFKFTNCADYRVQL